MALTNPPYVHSPGLNPARAAPYIAAASSYLTPPAPAPTRTPAAPSTPAPPASPTVDYGTLLANDPILGQSNANTAAQTITNQASLTAARRAALASYGQIPANLGTAAGNAAADIDPTTRQLADQATQGGVSTVARLSHAYDQAQQGDIASLAARGMLRSGATGQHLSEDLSNYNIAGYDAQSKLLDYLNGLWQGFQQQQQALQQQGIGARTDALNRIIEEIKSGLIGGPAAPPPVAPPQAIPGIDAYASGGQPDPFANLNNLSQADWARLSQLPVNRNVRLPTAVAA